MELLVLVKRGLLIPNLRDVILKRVYYFISWDHLLLYLFALFLYRANLLPNLLNFREYGAGLPDVLNFFDQARFVTLAPIIRLQAMLELANSPLQLGLIVVDRVYTPLNFL